MDKINPADCLQGLTLEGGWKVCDKIEIPEYATGGHFSVGYYVENENGEEGFLKALDYTSAFQADDPARELENMTKAYNFERDILRKCKQNRLSKVVMPLSDGTIEIDGNFGPLSKVNYIIFEKANGDIRDFIELSKKFDMAWSLRSLHNSATGLKQLHTNRIAHQDLKPSNILVFETITSKISDLGRAADDEFEDPPHAKFIIPGDKNYASPELLYQVSNFDLVSKFGADIYQLGSLIFFHFTGVSALANLKVELGKNLDPNFSGNDFQNDLPILQNAFTRNLKNLETEILKYTGEKISKKLIEIARNLCNPDPSLRGHPSEKLIGNNLYRLDRFVSELNLLARYVEMKIHV